MPSKQIVKRTVAAGTIAGCSAVGLGALSTLAAPTANACWLGCHSTQNTTKNSNNNSGVSVSVSQNNGTTTQSTGAFSGNNLSPQFGLGVLTAAGPTQTSASAPISNVAVANGTLNPVTITAFQLTTNTNICTGPTLNTAATGGTHCSAG